MQLKTELEKKMQTAKVNYVQRTEQLQKKMPDVRPLADYITAEGNKLYDEIQSDPTLKHICDAV